MAVIDRAPAPRTVLPAVTDRKAPFSALLLRLALGGLAVVYVGAGIVLVGASWILPDGLLAAGVALLITLPWLRGALDALLVILPFMFYTLSPVGGILTVGTSDSFLPVVALTVFLGAGGAVAVDTRRDGQQRLGTGAWFLLAAALLMIGTTVWWTVFSPGFLFTRAVADGVKLAIGFAYLVVIYRLCLRAGWDSAVRSVGLWVWTSGGLSLCVVFGAVVGLELVPTDGYRSLGYFEDANLFAGYLLVSLSLVVFLAFVRPNPWLIPHAVLLLFAMVATGSRGGLLSLALLTAFATLVINSLKLRLFVLAATGLATAIGVVLLGGNRPTTTILGLDRLFFASQSVSDDPRMALWIRAIEKWLDAPLWGIGMGQFERFSGDVFRVSQTSGLGYVTHNSFLYFLASFGLLGGGLFLAFLVWMTRRLYAAKGMVLSARHGLAAGLLMICSQMVTLNLQNLRYVWAYFGLVLGLAALARQRPVGSGGEDDAARG